MSFTPEQLKELALQLSCPNGNNGIDVANLMHDTNFGMTKSAIDASRITDNDIILELGHGNGNHISTLMQRAKNLSYYGLEISELMKAEAESLQVPNSSFYIYDGENIPFEDEKFNKAMTVNTIYFWRKPFHLLNEVYRVLKTGGLFSIVFAQKEFMETLPFTQHGFNLYDNTELENLVKQTPFRLKSLTDQIEQVRSKADEMVDRLYSIAILQK